MAQRIDAASERVFLQRSIDCPRSIGKARRGSSRNHETIENSPNRELRFRKAKPAEIGRYAENEVPQPQVPVALGLENLKPPPWRPVTKSMTVPREIWCAGAIDVDRYIAELEPHIVGLLLIFEVELIGETGTAAIGDTDTKPIPGTLIARQQLFHLLDSAIR